MLDSVPQETIRAQGQQPPPMGSRQLLPGLFLLLVGAASYQHGLGSEPPTAGCGRELHHSVQSPCGPREQARAKKPALLFRTYFSSFFFFSPFNVEESDDVAVPSRVPCSSWLRQTPEPGVLGVTIRPGVVALGWGRMGTPGGFGGLLRAATALPQPQEPERGSAGRREVMGPFEKVEGPRRGPWSQLSVCPQLAAP